ncbi:MAG TPA: hypothetical protein VJ302_17375, partial [Blastocatellia bacterium]|nr:hypothetical protein [Blastocatellia bacterium]
VLYWGAPPSLRNVTIGVVEGNRVIPAGQTESISEEAPAGSVSQSFSSALPQSSIDEIVNRVVAQVTERLPEILSRELVHRMAPELIEIVKGQLIGDKKVYREADSLLELDEI